MASLKNLLPDKRRTTVLVSLVLLLVLFLVPYFIVYIPANADNIKRQAFQNLDRAALNIVNKNTDIRNYYKLTNADSVFRDTGTLSSMACSSNRMDNISQRDSLYFAFLNSSGWSILYSRRVDSKRQHYILVQAQPLVNFMPSCLSSGKELFSSYLLVHYCQHMGADSNGKIIYQNFAHGLEQDVNLDSLVPRHEGMRPPDMSDISLEGTDYKLFTYPFQLGRHRLIICGLMKTDGYNAKLHVIPLGTVYVLVICLFLFLLSLPFLKIFMMNERDRIFASNLIAGVIFLFLLSAFITMICTQLILLKQERKEISHNLETISSNIEDSLTKELIRAQQQLTYFDSQMVNILVDSGNFVRKDTNTVAYLVTRDKDHPKFPIPPRRLYYGPNPYYHNFDHCSWISDAGQELLRIKYLTKELVDTITKLAKQKNYSYKIDTTLFVNVKQRPYYQEIYRRNQYLHKDSMFLMLAPVQSWASGQFRVNICRYSQSKNFLMQLMETRLYSLVNTVLPAGYGYCLFKDSGDVLIHSDTLKSLRENFLDETGQLPWILDAIKGRQGIQSSEASFYGTNHTLRLQPLKQHPLFLAVFYNNDFLEPQNIRILSFSMLFCMITFGLLILLYRVWNNPEPKTCLYADADYYNRLMPRKDKLNLYFSGSLFLLAYIFIFSLALICAPTLDHDFDYTLMVFGLLTPFHICYGMHLVQSEAGQCKNLLGLCKFLMPVALVASVVYGLSYIIGSGLNLLSFALVEIAIWVGIATIVLKRNNAWVHIRSTIRAGAILFFRWGKKPAEERRLFSYSWFISLFIFAMAVLPALNYCWFAYNHELRQSVKREQLEIAIGLQKRDQTVRAFLRKCQPDFSIDSTYYRDIQYRQGIYPLFGDTVNEYPERAKKADADSNSEIFYLKTAGFGNLFYKDPAGFPPLYDRSRFDNLWEWTKRENEYKLSFSRPVWKIPPLLSDTTEPKRMFEISTAIPEGIKTNGRSSFILGVLMIGLLLAIYWITKSMARQVFLTRIVGDAERGLDNQYGNNGDSDWKKCMYENRAETDVKTLIHDLKKEYPDFANRTIPLVKMEAKIIQNADDSYDLFECVWQKLDDREKYQLYCLAHDGLLNHKNESVIYGLLNKNLVVIYDMRLRLVSYSFRNFILSRDYSPEENKMLLSMQSGASWIFLRTIVVVLISSVFIFLFLTQQEISTKLIAIITSLSALLPFVLKFGSGMSSGAKNNSS